MSVKIFTSQIWSPVITVSLYFVLDTYVMLYFGYNGWCVGQAKVNLDLVRAHFPI